MLNKHISPEEAVTLGDHICLGDVYDMLPFQKAFVEARDMKEWGPAAACWFYATLFVAGRAEGIRQERKKRAAKSANSKAAQEA